MSVLHVVKSHSMGNKVAELGTRGVPSCNEAKFSSVMSKLAQLSDTGRA